MKFEAFHNSDKGVSFGIVFVPEGITVCFWKWEWTVTR